MKAREKVLILCTANSCRSQMAEGFLRRYGNDQYEVFSAGTMSCYVNEIAIEVMTEVGIDISGHKSKTISQLPTMNFDYVITVCASADAICPVFPGNAKKLHWPFPDPPHDQGKNEKIVNGFRKVRDAIHSQFKKAAEKGILSANEDLIHNV